MKAKATILGACFCCLMLARPVDAAIDIQLNVKVGDKVEFSWPSGHSDTAGPFLGMINNDAANTWRTFCVEADGASEFINPNGTEYWVVGLASNSATATNNMVTEAAKYLYYAYGHDGLAGYVDDNARNNSLQQAIWSLVTKNNPGNLYPPNPTAANYVYTGGPIDFLDVGTLSADALAWRSLAVTAVTGANAADALALSGRIGILNPDSSIPAQGEQNQSMLYEVPEPASLVVWSCLAGGATGLAVLKRRRQDHSSGRWTNEGRNAIFAVVEHRNLNR